MCALADVSDLICGTCVMGTRIDGGPYINVAGKCEKR